MSFWSIYLPLCVFDARGMLSKLAKGHGGLHGDGGLWRRSEGLVHPRPEITMDKEIEAQQS
jgi:hypothetical protein